jgi:hypothetical protein
VGQAGCDRVCEPGVSAAWQDEDEYISPIDDVDEVIFFVEVFLGWQVRCKRFGEEARTGNVSRGDIC